MRFRAVDVAAATGGTVHGDDVWFTGVSFDSRSVQPGQLFVPLVAERDGHRFVEAAIAAGAAGYLSSAGAVGPGPRIDVADTLTALMDLARDRRTRFAGTVVAITGSVGKTSTKDFARAAVGRSRRTTANIKSLNNDFGLPATILNADDDSEVLIVEMGMRGFGEIERLCTIAQPNIGIVTTVAEAHSDRLGGLDGVAAAKAELVRALPPAGTAILNADDRRVAAMAEFAPCPVVTYGSTSSADVRVSDVRLDEAARATFHLDSPWGATDVRLAISGVHMVANATAALALCGVLGADVGAGAEALGEVTAGSQRMAMRRSASGATVIDDSYNANPTSMRAALDALAHLPASRRMAVLGVMAEILDPASEHRAIRDYAEERGIEVIAAGTDLYGIAPADDPAAAVGSLAAGDAVLVKGSRVAGLERVADQLVGR